MLGVAAASAFLHGDHPLGERRARAGLALATTVNGSLLCWGSLAIVGLSRGDYAEVLEHALAVADATPRPSVALAVAALAATYGGELDRGRALNARMAEIAVSPTMSGFCAYAAGEIAHAAGSHAEAQQRHTAAIVLARDSGTTLLAGVASVGLAGALAAGGRTDDALRAYRDVMEYFAAAGNWSHLWTTLLSLAELLRGLGGPEPAELIDAAEQAPDHAPTPDRAQVLDAARRAIGRRLDRS